MKTIRRFVPLLDHLSRYDRADLRGDLTAGLTVGVMLIPQGMAYALIAGLPPIYGLYASLVPLLVFAAFGTSRQLSVAPVAMVSLLTAAGVAPLAGGSAEAYIGLAVLLALMVGIIQFALGAARFGFLTNYLSHPVLAGFTSAAALIIGFSQLKHLLGIDLARSHHVHEILLAAAARIGEVHVATLLVGIASIVVLVGLRRWNRAFPGALVVVALSTLAVWGFSLHETGVRIVADVPRGLPSLSMPGITLEGLRALLPTALVIALVGFMESIAVAKVYASRNRYRVDADQELIGLGLANIAGSFFQSYPTTGGFSRTAVNAQAGARTQLAAVFTAGIIGLTLLFLTPLFYYLPQAVLAAIVMVAVFGLIDWKEARFLWKVDRRDFGLMMVTFLATLGLGIEQGILVGVVASILVAVHQSSRPHTAVQGRLPGTDVYRNVDRNPVARRGGHVLVFRMDASLYFANIEHFKDRLRESLHGAGDVRTVVLDAFPINRLDSSAAHALEEVVDELRAENRDVCLAAVKGPVRDVLEKAGVVAHIGSDRFYLTVHEAVRSAEQDDGEDRHHEERPDDPILAVANS